MDADRNCVDTAPDINSFQKRLLFSFVLIHVCGGPAATFPFPMSTFRQCQSERELQKHYLKLAIVEHAGTLRDSAGGRGGELRFGVGGERK